MPRKGTVVKEGVSPRQFCCVCILFLGSVLFLQVCVLASLLRRLAEVRRAAPSAASLQLSPGLSQAASRIAQAATAGAAPRLRATGSAPASDAVSTATDTRGFALGVAVGQGTDEVLLFLSSLLKASQCQIVIFSDQPLSQEAMQAEGIDVQRVSFERISLPLPEPWDRMHINSARFSLYKSYLERTAVLREQKYIQLSDVGNVAIQADPFVWLAAQPKGGVHVFSDEPSRIAAADQSTQRVLSQCYASQVTAISSQTLIPSGYVIGASEDIKRYVDRLVDELRSQSNCIATLGGGVEAKVDQAVHNVIARGPAAGFAVHVSENRRGAVWSGANVPHAAILLDSSNVVINEDGYQYAVLHQYNEHEDLRRSLIQRFLKGRTEKVAPSDCSSFDVQPGDMRGNDLDHIAANSQKDCCVACLSAPGCGAFIFSSSRGHCWMKSSGGFRSDVRLGDDLMCGIRSISASGAGLT